MTVSRIKDWRIITPVVSLVSPIIVGCFSFFLVRMINQFDERNKENVELIHKVMIQQESTDKKVADLHYDFGQKYVELRYRCCGEITNQQQKGM